MEGGEWWGSERWGMKVSDHESSLSSLHLFVFVRTGLAGYSADRGDRKISAHIMEEGWDRERGGL